MYMYMYVMLSTSFTNKPVPMVVYCIFSVYTLRTGNEISKLLLEEAMLDPNAKNNDGDTPLHTACRNKNYKLVKLLVRDERCNPHEKNSKGDTALHIACCLTDSFGKRCNLHANVTSCIMWYM